VRPLRWLSSLFKLATAAGMGNLERQVEAAQGMLVEDPDDALALVMLANVRFQQGRLAEARDLRDRLHSNEPNNLENLRALGEISKRLEDHQAADRYLTIAVELAEAEVGHDDCLHRSKVTTDSDRK